MNPAGDEVREDETPLDGPDLLDWLEVFLARFVYYPNEAARAAHVLWIAHTWFMQWWSNTPRIAFLSPEPGSGKSRALELTAHLVPNPVHTVNVTVNYVFRKIADPQGLPTLIFDEVDTFLSPRGRINEDLRGLLNAGYRRGATVGRCRVSGDRVVTEDLDAFAAVALAGLGNLPDTILSRSVIIEMRRRAPGEPVEPWRDRVSGPRAANFSRCLAAWASCTQPSDAPVLPLGLVDRAADVWEPLIGVADLAGGDWPQRARQAALGLKDIGQNRHEGLGIELLRDLSLVFRGEQSLFTRDILARLRVLEESPWSDLDGKTLDARRLAHMLKPYGATPKHIRRGADVGKGYERAALEDAFARYLPSAEMG